MAWYSKITKAFKKKEAVEYGGFELLKRLTAGSWSKTKMLETYEKSLYVFACVSKIAEKIAATDFSLYQILNSTGDTKELINHPAVDLIYRVNPFQTKNEFLKITEINLKLAGDAFWYKVRNDRGQVVELWNLRPDYMEIVKDPEEFIKGYKLTKTDGTTEVFMPDEIVHFKHPTPLDEYYGVSPVRSAQVRIDTEDFASNYQRDFFLNNARPDAVLKMSDGATMTEEEKQEAREYFETQHKGRGNNSKVAILTGGLEYQQISVNQKEMDFIESMKFTRDDILVAFGVPKTVVAITDDVNRANAETAMYVFLSETIKPELEMLTEKINEMLVIPDFGENLFLDFPDPTPENRDQTLKDYDSGLTKGWLTINEVRTKEGREPIDGGDSVLLPINLQPIGSMPAASAQKMRDAFIEKINHNSTKRRLKVFRGRDLLRKKFIIAEQLVEEMKNLKTTTTEKVKAIKKAGKTTKAKEPKVPCALINGDELRIKYANMVLKAIDSRADRFKTEVTKKAQIQGNALLLKLQHEGDLTKTVKGIQRKAIGKDTKKLVNDYYDAEGKVWAEFSFPFVEEFARQAGMEAMAIVSPDKTFEISATLSKALQKRAEQFGLGVNETTRDRVTKAIEDGLKAGEGMTDISARISNVYEDFPTWRSDLIARTESTAANNEGFMEAYKQSEVATHKEWVAVMDTRTRPEHADLNGEIVPVGKSFSNGLQYPQEPNCRCVLAPAFEQ